MNDANVKRIVSDDVKLILATVSIVVAVLGSFFTLQNQVVLLSSKIDNALASINRQQNLLEQITEANSTRDSRLATLEAIVNIKNKP